MKSETLNGALTFVLGVLVVLGVVFALRVAFITHDTRVLQSQELFANTQIVRAKAIIAETQAYNQKYPSVELQHILQSLQPANPKQ